MNYINGRDAMAALHAFVKAKMDGEYSQQFANYGGADAVLEDDEPTEPEHAGRPYIVFSLGSDSVSEWSAPANPRNDVEVQARTVANDFNGAQIGAANIEGSDTILSRVLTQIIEGGTAELAALGLHLASISATTETIRDNGGGEFHENPHIVRATYFKE